MKSPLLELVSCLGLQVLQVFCLWVLPQEQQRQRVTKQASRLLQRKSHQEEVHHPRFSFCLVRAQAQAQMQMRMLKHQTKKSLH